MNAAIIIQGLTMEEFANSLSEIITEKVTEAVRKVKDEDNMEKLISPADACKLFTPAISKPSLERYVKNGYFNKYHLGGRTWLRYSEIMAALKTIKRYQRS
jgi:hypothetical protein